MRTTQMLARTTGSYDTSSLMEEIEELKKSREATMNKLALPIKMKLIV